MPIQIENFTEQKLDLTFEGVLSAEGYSVTEPELLWTYEGDGAVKIVRKETGYWKSKDLKEDRIMVSILQRKSIM